MNVPRKDQIDKGFGKEMAAFVEEMRKRNDRPVNMAYFDDVLVNTEGRLREIRDFRENGGKVIGTICMFVPEELIYAADAIPISLTGSFQEAIPVAEEVIPRSICPLVKSMFGSFMLKHAFFGMCNAVVCPTTCDCKKKGCEILMDYVPNTEVIIIELPQTIDTPQARRLWLTEITLLKKKIEDITGNKITERKLRHAINLVNNKRKVIRRLYKLGTARSSFIGFDVMYAIAASFYDDINRWIDGAEKLYNELEERNLGRKGSGSRVRPRIMLAGCPIVPPNWKIPRLIEVSGGGVVCDELCTGSRGMWDLVVSCEWKMDDILIALAERYLMMNCACFTPNNNRIEGILRWVKEYEVDGVVYHILQGCHLYSLEALLTKTALDKAGVPMLRIETEYGEEDWEQIRTRIEAFLEMIMARGSP